jgi:phosphatidylinositol alpha-1,6-mannosyltransferase
MVSREEAMGDIEGFGMVFLEAGQYGLPVIAGNSGGQAEAVINDKTGLVVDSSNEQKVAEAIIKLLTDQNLAKNMGQRGKERVEKDFRWEVEAEKIQKILN